MGQCIWRLNHLVLSRTNSDRLSTFISKTTTPVDTGDRLDHDPYL